MNHRVALGLEMVLGLVSADLAADPDRWPAHDPVWDGVEYLRGTLAARRERCGERLQARDEGRKVGEIRARKRENKNGA